MQFTTSFLALLAAAVATAAPSTGAGAPSTEGGEAIASNSWAGQTWTGTSCQGTQLFWTVPDGSTCTSLQSVSSLKVTNFGGCSTTYFTDSNCQDNPIHVDTEGSCQGYAQGERIGSFIVRC